MGGEKVLDRGEISVQLAAHSCDPGFYRELEGYGILDEDGTIPVVVAAADESMILTMNRLEHLAGTGALLVTAYSGHIHVVSLRRVPSGVSGPRAQALKAGATVQQWCDSLRQGGAQAFYTPGVESVPGGPGGDSTLSGRSDLRTSGYHRRKSLSCTSRKRAAMTGTQHFLLVFDHKKDRLVEQVEFGSDASAATAAYSELERKYKDDLNVDVVLVGSDSLETVRVTHSTYFEGMSASLIDQALQIAG